LIFHGYLLRGTGSNVYNASLAQALAGLGHEVHLVCQDRDAGSLDWVDAVGSWNGGRLEVTTTSSAAADGTGSVTAYTPDIGRLLPVYVHDRYDGFEVKTFGELSDSELDAYLTANVAAVRDVAAGAGGVDAALANHLVMGPAILARAALGAAGTGPPGFAVKIHGSALEFTVRREPERFLPYAREGLTGAAGVLVGSRHTAEVLWETVADEALPARTRLGPPGVDVDLFAMRERHEADQGVRELAADLSGEVSAELSAGVGREALHYATEIAQPPRGDDFGRDLPAAAAAVAAFAVAAGPRVIFVGKLIRTKGVDLLLAAWPLVASRHRGAHLLIVGFGEALAQTERLWSALAAGDLDEARAIARAGGDQGGLKLLDAFLSSLPPGYVDAGRAAAGSVSFAGRLEHGEVARVMPAADAMVVPSTFPEAFGMVAAEAAAAGVLPICADHSGLHEVAASLAERVPVEVAPLLAFDLGDGAVDAIANRLNSWLRLPQPVRERTRIDIARTVAERWSWKGVAASVLAASSGDLGEIPVVPPASTADRRAADD
jgi:glycosyltransferase involved in cell wall biosynthesis